MEDKRELVDIFRQALVLRFNDDIYGQSGFEMLEQTTLDILNITDHIEVLPQVFHA